MLKLLCWYFLERLVKVPAGIFMRIHRFLIIRTIKALKDIDDGVPRELTAFRSFPSVSRKIGITGEGKETGSEAGVLSNVAPRYGSDPEDYMDMMDNMYIEAARKTRPALGNAILLEV